MPDISEGITKKIIGWGWMNIDEQITVKNLSKFLSETKLMLQYKGHGIKFY